MLFQRLTSSLQSLLISFLIGSMSCTCPAVNPTNNNTLSGETVVELKSWQVGNVPLQIRLSMGLVRSAACNNLKKFALAPFVQNHSHSTLYFKQQQQNKNHSFTFFLIKREKYTCAFHVSDSFTFTFRTFKLKVGQARSPNLIISN